ncbi:hypothetical protein KBC80_03635 [Candidatus Woesebacteria bacterium]|nr:hypothetical protein [Candidatus Woesebacteria bacterium]
MARHKSLRSPMRFTTPIISIFIVLIIGLITIGDTIRSFITFVFSIPKSVWLSLKTVSRELTHASTNWLMEKYKDAKKSIQIKKQKKPVTQRPQTITILVLSVLQILYSLWVMIRTSISNIHFSFPHISLPKLQRRTSKTQSVKIEQPPQTTPTSSQAKNPSSFHIQSFTVGMGITILFILLPYNTFLFL